MSNDKEWFCPECGEKVPQSGTSTYMVHEKCGCRFAVYEVYKE